MHIKSIMAGAAIALAATVGSAYAAETFDTMRGVPVEALDTVAMEGVRAGDLRLTVFRDNCGFFDCIRRAVVIANDPVGAHIEIFIGVDGGAVSVRRSGSSSIHPPAPSP